jgi:hypothetical protein
VEEVVVRGVAEVVGEQEPMAFLDRAEVRGELVDSVELLVGSRPQGESFYPELARSMVLTVQQVALEVLEEMVESDEQVLAHTQ